MIKYFAENNLISPHLPGFRPGDSITQLLSINREILRSFVMRLEEGYSLTFQKSLIEFGNEAFNFKLRQNGIYGAMINILKYFLSNRKQRILLRGHCSSWVDIRFGAPQCSILWPLLFLIYINDLSVGLKSECKLFADDTSLFAVVHDVNISKNDRNSDLQKTYEWTYQ